MLEMQEQFPARMFYFRAVALESLPVRTPGFAKILKFCDASS